MTDLLIFLLRMVQHYEFGLARAATDGLVAEAKRYQAERARGNQQKAEGPA